MCKLKILLQFDCFFFARFDIMPNINFLWFECVKCVICDAQKRRVMLHVRPNESMCHSAEKSENKPIANDNILRECATKQENIVLTIYFPTQSLSPRECLSIVVPTTDNLVAATTERFTRIHEYTYHFIKRAHRCSAHSIQ